MSPNTLPLRHLFMETEMSKAKRCLFFNSQNGTQKGIYALSVLSNILLKLFLKPERKISKRLRSKDVPLSIMYTLFTS